MFNIHSTELILIAIVALIVIGPEKLPATIRTASLWIGRFRRSFHRVKADIERELNADEIRRQLHNESVMEDIEQAKQQVKAAADQTRGSVNTIVNSDNFDPGASPQTEKQVEQQQAGSNDSGEESSQSGNAEQAPTGQDTPEQTRPEAEQTEQQIESAKEEIAQASQEIQASRDKLYGTGKNPKLAQRDDPPDGD
ncbi:MAG: Sec-independent protein translocase protein TatB [Pseudohongiellaceae bacterium]|jgi:sec-independent protein translocase protein TatB